MRGQRESWPPGNAAYIDAVKEYADLRLLAAHAEIKACASPCQSNAATWLDHPACTPLGPTAPASQVFSDTRSAPGEGREDREVWNSHSYARAAAVLKSVAVPLNTLSEAQMEALLSQLPFVGKARHGGTRDLIMELHSTRRVLCLPAPPPRRGAAPARRARRAECATTPSPTLPGAPEASG